MAGSGEVSVECENMPIALLSKDRYKVKNPHKQVPEYSEQEDKPDNDNFPSFPK